MRRGGAALVACALAATTAVLFVAGASAAASPIWHVAPRAPLTAVHYGQIEVSCAGRDFCLAVGAGGRTATWNGSSWRSAPGLPSRVGSVTQVSCVTSSFCAATATSGTKARTDNYAVVWTGASWGAPTLLYAVRTEAGFYTWVHGVSCTSTTFCMTVGGGDSFEWDGRTWAGHPGILTGTDGNGVIACASSSMCVNLHDDSPNTWNGSTWHYVRSESLGDAVPGVAGFFTEVSCGAATLCVAVGVQQGAVVWDGAHWRVPGGAARAASSSVSCAGAAFCVAISRTARATVTWDGASWRTLAGFPLGTRASVSCGRAGSCVAVASSGATAVLS